MIDKEFEWNIDGVQANTVLECAEVELPIDKNNYKDIFINNDILVLLGEAENLLRSIFNSNDEKLNRSILDEFHLSYRISKNHYYIDFDYEEIFKNVLNKLGLNNGIKLNNITTEEEYNEFIKKIKKEIAISNGLSDNEEIEELKDMLFINIHNILHTLLIVGRNAIVNHYTIKQIEAEKELRENHKNLNKSTEKHISWKNLMFYTAVKSLNEFKYTRDIKHYRYAKNYFKNVSTNAVCEYPKSMYIDGDYYNFPYAQFNTRFMSIQSHYFHEILIRLGIEDKDTITLDRTLKKGKGMKATISDNPKHSKKIDYSKINETLGRKITFYKGLSGKVQGIIKGLDTDTDYIGYVLPNNYVIFDKFYELSKDGTKANPAYGNRVYIVTLDILEACNHDKQKIGDYIAKNHDFKAFRYNHTDTDSYQERVKEVLDYHDISTVKYKEYVLRHENNQNN